MFNKKIILVIFAIICLIFLSNNLYSLEIKPSLDQTTNAYTYGHNEDISNLHITSVSFVQNTDSKKCTLNLTFDKTYLQTKLFGAYQAIGVIINEYPTSDDVRRTYGSKMNKIVKSNIIASGSSDKILTNSSHPNYVDPDFKAIIYWNNLGTNKFSSTYDCSSFNSNKVDVFIFRPEKSTVTGVKLNNVYIFYADKKDIKSLDIGTDSSGIFRQHPPTTHMYNIAYAYDVPVTKTSATTSTTTDCSTKCSGYKSSANYPSNPVKIGSNTLNKGQVCYKCISYSQVERCDPITGTKGGITSLPSPLRAEICPNEFSAPANNNGSQSPNNDSGQKSEDEGDNSQSSDQITEDTENNGNNNFSKTIFNFNLEAKISSVKYSLSGDAKEYAARKIDSPESYFIDYKNKTKNVQVYLSGFNKDQPMFAIITTPEKLNDIDKELKAVLEGFNDFSLSDTDNFLNKIKDYAKVYSFKNYIAQSDYIINNGFKLDYWDNINFKLGTQNQFKFNIENGTENNQFVLIFMQISDIKKINIAYTNLYILDSKELSAYNLCEINRKTMAFYCNGEECNLPKNCLDRWDFEADKFWREPVIEKEQPETTETIETTETTETIETTSYSFNGKCSILKQKTVEEYITCLRNNINTVDLVNKKYEFVNVKAPIVIGNEIINQKYNSTYYAANSNCYNNESYNRPIFEAAKNAKLTEEETSQLWARLSAESGCNPNVNCGDSCTSYGVGQINNSWNNATGYNSIKKYLIEINSSKYDTFEKYQNIFNKMKSASRNYQDNVSSVELSIAINKYHKKLILNASSGATKPFMDIFDKEYDHDDAIDIMFATGYVYNRGSSSAPHFSDGVTIGVTRWQGVVYPALRKIGYYLIYKRMIYNCHNSGTTNAFVTAYKNVYGGKYCDKVQTIRYDNKKGQDTSQKIEDDKYNTFSQTPLVNGVDIVNYAKKYVGYKYLWGGNCLTGAGSSQNLKGVDCSGFIREIYSHFGIEIRPRNSKYQTYCGTKVERLEDAQPGDVLAFARDNGKSFNQIHHVAMYAGKDSSGNVMIVHAKGKNYGIVYEKISSKYVNELYSIKRYVNVKVCKNTPVDATLKKNPVCFLS